MSAPPLESSFFYRMATSLNKAWADWFTALGVTQSGLGTMATQNANAVAITGGSVAGISLPTGTFTPTLVSSGGGAPTYSNQVGTYTVIGNRVTFNCAVTLATYGTLAAGNLTIAGLPFTSDATPANATACSVGCFDLDATAITDIQAQITSGAAVITLLKYAAGARSNLTKANTSSTAGFRISGSYQV